MRGCRLRCRLRAASFQNDNWLGQGDFPGGGEERAGIADGLQVDDDAGGLRVATQLITQDAPADVHHRANRDKGTETNIFAQTPIQHGGAKGTALADEADMTGPGHGAGKGGVEAGQRVHHAKAVGTDNAQLPLARSLQDLLLQLGARCAAFLEPGRNDNGPFDASLDTLRNNPWHGGCGRGNDCEINRLRQGCQAGVRFDTQDASALRIDGKNRSSKWIADQVPEERTPDAACFFRRPNDRDALRSKDGIEGMALLVAKDGGGDYSAPRRISGWSSSSTCLHKPLGPFISIS